MTCGSRLLSQNFCAHVAPAQSAVILAVIIMRLSELSLTIMLLLVSLKYFAPTYTTTAGCPKNIPVEPDDQGIRGSYVQNCFKLTPAT